MTGPQGASVERVSAATQGPEIPFELLPSAGEILARLLAATPTPPADAAIEQLLATFEAVVTQRAAIIAAIVPPLPLTDADRLVMRELEGRQAAWRDALAAAQHAVGKQRGCPDQLRAYAQHL